MGFLDIRHGVYQQKRRAVHNRGGGGSEGGGGAGDPELLEALNKFFGLN